MTWQVFIFWKFCKIASLVIPLKHLVLCISLISCSTPLIIHTVPQLNYVQLFLWKTRKWVGWMKHVTQNSNSLFASVKREFNCWRSLLIWLKTYDNPVYNKPMQYLKYLISLTIFWVSVKKEEDVGDKNPGGLVTPWSLTGFPPSHLQPFVKFKFDEKIGKTQLQLALS